MDGLWDSRVEGGWTPGARVRVEGGGGLQGLQGGGWTLPQKIGAWERILSFWVNAPIFRGQLIVLGRASVVDDKVIRSYGPYLLAS